MKQQFHIVIPARYGSTRLPGKPLREIAGVPMIRRVYQQAARAGAARVIVATDDNRIEQVVREFGGEVVMTSSAHPSGTDRLQEVADRCRFGDNDILVNVQGDEPLIPPRVIAQVAANLGARPSVAVATLCEPIATLEDFENPNIVKVVCDRAGFALYFSRASIPWPRDHFQAGERGLPANFAALRHIGLYAYRVRHLNRFVEWPASPLESIESLEQLRFLWQGERIHVEKAAQPVPAGVDTEADLQRVIDIVRREGAND